MRMAAEYSPFHRGFAFVDNAHGIDFSFAGLAVWQHHPQVGPFDVGVACQDPGQPLRHLGQVFFVDEVNSFTEFWF